MMRRSIIAAGVVCLAAPALATPSINVHSYWSAYVLDAAPVTVACGGSATPIALGCTSTLSVSRSINDTETGIASNNGTTTFSNPGLAPTGLFIVELDAAPFNAGGSNLGVAIDTAANQTASFTARATIDRLDLTTGCSLPGAPGRASGINGYIFSPTSCGLQAPDASSAFLYLDLTPGQDVTVYGALSISYAFDPPDVPEPASFMLLGIGLIALGGIKLVS